MPLPSLNTYRMIYHVIIASTLIFDIVISDTSPISYDGIVGRNDNDNGGKHYDDDIAYKAAKQLGELNQRLNQLYREEEARQFQLPNITNLIASRIPCSCDNGLCKCCAGLLSVIGMNSCTEVAYRPDEFSFELRLRLNDKIWFRRKVSGQNPRPLCFHPPRFNFAEACIQFYDIWFAGRNMHVCMSIEAEFQGFELFDRNFDCLLFGDTGINIIKPEDNYPIKPADVDIDDGDDEIEDYDENVIRRKLST